MSDLAFLLEVAAERDRLRAENERLTGLVDALRISEATLNRAVTSQKARLAVYQDEVASLGREIAEDEKRIAEMEGEIAALAAPCQIDGCQFPKLIAERDTAEAKPREMGK